MIYKLFLFFLLAKPLTGIGSSSDQDKDPQPPTSESEFSTTDTEDDDFLNETGESAFSTGPTDGRSQIEIREETSRSLGLGLFSNLPWQSINIQGGWTLSPKSSASAFIGGGAYTSENQKIGSGYQIDAVTKALGGEYRFFPSESFSFYISQLIGAVHVAGDVRLQGGQTDEAAVSPQTQSSFEAYGIFASVGLGVSHIWESGFFIDYSIVGLNKTYLVQKSLSNDDDSFSSKVKTDLEAAQIWGFINIKVGYFFKGS